MDKEEILEKSRRENQYGDEGEKAMRVKRDSVGGWGFIVMGAVIMAVRLCRVESPADIISLFFCSSGLSFVYEGIQAKRKTQLFFGIFFLLCAAYFFYKFLVGKF